MINSGDTAWVLISTALVILMTPAVGFFYGGMVRKKNILSTIMMCFAALIILTLQWYLIGFSLSFAPSIRGLIGRLDWLGLEGVGLLPNTAYAATIPFLAFMIFQAAFAIIAPALIVGAFVERIRFSSFLIFCLIWTTIIYDPVAHWVWANGGWLRQLGVLDFAGGLVIHITAGFSALAIALVIGKRRGYGKDNMEPSNIPLVLLGAFLLWFGWFGFNGGSALAANGVAVSAFVATNAAGAAGAAVWMILTWMQRRPSILGVATGAVVGLAAITPGSGYVSPLAALFIGGVASIIAYSVIWLRMKLRIDESLDVFACHGMGSFWGVVALGPLTNKIFIQLFAACFIAIFSFIATFIIAKIIDNLIGLRVKENEELVGLDISQHAETV